MGRVWVLVGDSLTSWLSGLGQLAPLSRSLCPPVRESCGISFDKVIWFLQSTVHIESFETSLASGPRSLGVPGAKPGAHKGALRAT